MQFLSAASALLGKHRLTAEVVNTKPAGCNSGELEALWQSDSSLPRSLLFLMVEKKCLAVAQNWVCCVQYVIYSSHITLNVVQYLINSDHTKTNIFILGGLPSS